MTCSAAESHRRRSRRVGRLVCGVVAVMVSMAAITAVSPAQIMTVPPPAPNPELRAACGLKVQLVLDESYSIVSPTNYAPQVRGAANSFVNALEGTGSQLAITAFSYRGRTGHPGTGYARVTTDSATGFRNWINNTQVADGYNPSSATAGTNWQDGLLQLNRVTGGPPDLVVFVTDGDPNTRNTGPNNSNSTISTDTSAAGVQNALNAAVQAANDLKAGGQGPRIFAIGVGSAVDNATSRERLTKISGTTRFPRQDGTGTDNFSDADFMTVGFAGLETALRAIVAQLCEGSLTITKYEQAADGSALRPAEGWRFTASLRSTPPGSHQWLEPPRGSRRSASLTTGGDGVARFAWDLDADASAVLRVREHLRRGWRQVISTCDVNGGPPADVVGRTPQRRTRPITEPLTVQPGDWVTCTVTNRRRVAHLTVEKQLRPRDDPGRFDLFAERSRDLPVDGSPRQAGVGDGGSTERLVLPTGRYTVWERLNEEESPEGTTLAEYEVSTRCVNEATGREVASSEGTESDPVEGTLRSVPVEVRLRRETDDIVCTITNRRPGPPPEDGDGDGNGGDTPPPPCLDIVDDTPVCGDLAAAPNLAVTKRMPRRARVGDRVTITITVTNVGGATARTVRLHEAPARGARFARVAQGGSIRSDGTAVWRLGDLARGARRTVRATVLVTRTGLHTDTAVAAARNASPAFDVAAVRARAARRPPPVTG